MTESFLVQEVRESGQISCVFSPDERAAQNSAETADHHANNPYLAVARPWFIQ